MSLTAAAPPVAPAPRLLFVMRWAVRVVGITGAAIHLLVDWTETTRQSIVRGQNDRIEKQPQAARC
jgi:hypothetical protein